MPCKARRRPVFPDRSIKELPHYTIYRQNVYPTLSGITKFSKMVVSPYYSSTYEKWGGRFCHPCQIKNPTKCIHALASYFLVGF